MRQQASDIRHQASGIGHQVRSLLEMRGAHALDLDDLNRWGEDFGRTLSPPVLVALEGDLGAGKTTLAQAICRGVGISEDVTSPTFALVNVYESSVGTVYHLDLYRLRDERDLTNLGWDDIVNSGALVLVEWPDRAGQRLPPESVWIRLEHIEGDESRRRLIIP